MSNISINFQTVKQNINALLYNSNSISTTCENRRELLKAIELLENSLKDIPQVSCTAKECIYCIEGKCTSKEINMEDVEQNDNIKFLDIDYMACKTLKHKEY